MATKKPQSVDKPPLHPALGADSFYNRLTAGVDHRAEGTGDSSAALPSATKGKKRGRDVRGLERFRQVVFGENGWPRLQAMAARNPTLMYPPPGIDAARARLAQIHFSEEHMADDVVQDILAMREERRRVETSCTEADVQGNLGTTAAPTLTDQELAHYHRTQLDAFVAMLYEFNHLTFIKLPMSDTVQLLGRCGREAVAHVTEYETRLRLQHAARVSEVQGLRAEEERLQRRRLEIEADAARQAVEEAEQVQCALDATMQLSGHVLCTDDAGGGGENESVARADTAASSANDAKLP